MFRFLMFCVVGLDACYFRDIRTYKGNVSVTESGRACIRWDSLTNNNNDCKNCRVTDNFPDVSISAASNYCRQPRLKPGSDSSFYQPWCYTEGNTTEYCNIKHCPGQQYYRDLLTV